MSLIQEDTDDEVIERRLLDELAWDDRIDSSNIRVEVKGRRARLEGSVPSLHDRSIAVDSAWSVRGLLGVEDNLFVEHPSGQAPPSGGALKSNLERMLEWHSANDSSNIVVEVDGANVTLKGTVSTYWKKLRIESLVGQVAGVYDVTNALAVVPADGQGTDNRIAEALMDALYRRPEMHVDTLDITVDEGVVTLQGTVPDPWNYRNVLEVAQRTRGVRHVVDRVGIRD